MMEHNVIGHRTGAAARQLSRGPKISHIGHTDFSECGATGIVELAQLTGPEQSPRRNSRRLCDIAEVPRAGEFFVAGLIA
jgi:hypothetical protein